MQKIEQRPSPNHNERSPGRSVDILLLHYTGMRSGAEALARLCDPAAKVSAHYLIEEDGRLFQMVPEDRRAWHAGLACWGGDSDVNGCSLGIELVNPGHEFGYRSFPEAQMRSLLGLAEELCRRHPIPSHRVLGHSDVAPLRKEDPGELFDWPRLAAAGLGILPRPGQVLEETAAKARLSAFGYGYLEEDFAAVLRAFQRRFRPAAITGALDGETAALIDGLPASA
ncbi:MAG: N-acetylmuramoyl-L-alanine amidase [Rhodovibrionaceae bacterium]